MGLWKSEDKNEERHPFLEQAEDGPIVLMERPTFSVVTAAEDGETVDHIEVGDLEVEETGTEESVADLDDPATDEVDGADIEHDFDRHAVDEPTPATTLGAEIDAIVAFTRTTTADAIGRAMKDAEELRAAAMTDAEATVRDAEQTAATLRRSAEDETRAMRAAAEADAQSLRAVAAEEAQAITHSAKSTRDEAIAFRQAARDEADALLESAKATLANAETKAREIVAEAKREADALRADAAARTEQLSQAKLETAKRLEAAEAALRALHEVTGSGDVA